MAVAEQEQEELQVGDIQGEGLTPEEFWTEIEKGTIQANMEGKYSQFLEENEARYYLYDKNGSMFHVMRLSVDGDNGKRWRLLERDWNGPNVRESTIKEELFIDLRNKQYFFKRNGKELKFRISNLDQFIPRGSGDRNSDSRWSDFQKMVETEENAGMYEKLSNTLATMGEEISDNNGRMIHRLITRFSYLELLAKMDVDISSMDKSTIMLLENTAIDAQMENKTLNPATLLGVSKKKAKFFRRHNVAWTNKNISRLREMTDGDMKEIDDAYDLLVALDDKYGVEIGEELWNRGLKGNMFQGRESRNLYFFAQDIVNNRRFPHTNQKRLFEYLAYELPLTQGIDMERGGARNLFEDYLEMSVNMEVQQIDKYPDSLKKAHDVISANYKVVLSEVRKKQFEAEIENMKELEYAGRYKKMEIVVPEIPKDLTREGSVLGHCVGSYVDNIARGKCHIVFLREEKEEPLITVEIRRGKITQARGRFNRPVNEAEDASLVYFAKKHNLEYKSVNS